MIEVVTVNGFRKMVNPEHIVSFGELSNRGRSNTVISVSNGETLFVDDTYDKVKASIEYEAIKKDRERKE